MDNLHGGSATIMELPNAGIKIYPPPLPLLWLFSEGSNCLCYACCLA